METTARKDFKDSTVEPTSNPPSDPVEPTSNPPSDPVEPTSNPPSDPVEPTSNPPSDPVEPTNNPPADPVEPTNIPPSDPVVPKDNLPVNPVEPTNIPPCDPVASTNNPPDNPEESSNPPSDPVEPVNNPPRPYIESRKNADSSWKTKKENKKPKKLDYSNMPLEEKRLYYRCGNYYVTLDKVLPWPDYVRDSHNLFTKKGWLQKDSEFTTDNDHINKKVSLWLGDITQLEIDAIVNAANKSLLGGGGVDGCIHRAAGKGLLEECRKLNGCETGNSKITSGQKLPAKHVIHTVGPIGERQRLLESCYNSCLMLMKEHELSSVAFCCISTGIYGYPNKKAAHVAFKTVKTWLKENDDWVGRVIFCVFLQEDLDIYQKLMLKYFPCTIEKDVERTEESEDKPIGSKPNPSGPTVMPNDEKRGTTEATKTPRSKGRGRENIKMHTSEEMPPKPKSTLLSLTQHTDTADKTKSNRPKSEDNSHTEGSKGKVDDSGSFSRKRKDVGDDGDEKMDTSESDVGNTAKLAEGTTETTVDGKGSKGDSGSFFREIEVISGDGGGKMDISEGDTATGGGATAGKMVISEGDTQNTATAGGATAGKMVISEGDTQNTATEGGATAGKMVISEGDTATGGGATVGKMVISEGDTQNTATGGGATAGKMVISEGDTATEGGATAGKMVISEGDTQNTATAGGATAGKMVISEGDTQNTATEGGATAGKMVISEGDTATEGGATVGKMVISEGDTQNTATAGGATVGKMVISEGDTQNTATGGGATAGTTADEKENKETTV